MRALIFVLLISFTACDEQIKKVDQTEISRFQVPDSTYVILDYKNDWDWIFKDAKLTTLSKKELAEIETIIDKAVIENNVQKQMSLENHNKEYPDNKWTETGFELNTKGFKRQYVAVINGNGQKEVWVNFFCAEWGAQSWKTNIMVVDDGGNCFFNLKVNLETKTYSELCINGYA